jgi:integrase
MPVKREDAPGRVIFTVEAIAGRPYRRFAARAERPEEVARAMQEAWTYEGEGRRALDVLDAEVRALNLADLRSFVLARRLLPPGLTLHRFVENLYSTRTRPVGLDRAVELWMEQLRRQKASRHYLSGAGNIMRQFIDAAPIDTQLLAVSPTTIRDYLSSIRSSDHTHNRARSILSAFYGFCRDEGFVLKNPLDDIPKRRVSSPGEIPFLSLDTVKRMLPIVYEVAPETLYYFSLQLFAGFRPTEAEDYRPDPMKEFLRIEGARSKTRVSRTVPVSVPMRHLLHTLPPPLPIPKHSRRTVQRVRESLHRAGIRLPVDVLRHTYATHAFPLVGEVGLARDMGNSPGIIFAHYRGVVDTDEASRYMNLNPLEYLIPKTEHHDRVGGVLREDLPGEESLRDGE